MFFFSFALSNPFKFNRNKRYYTNKEKNIYRYDKMLVSFNKKVTKNKYLELDIRWGIPDWLIRIYFDLSFKGKDHAGLSILFQLLWFNFSFEFCDNRHWDYENNTWEEAEQTDTPG